MKYKNSERVVNIIIKLLLIMTAFIMLYPLWYILIASVSLPEYVNKGDVILLPKGFTLAGYDEVLKHKSIWTGYRNSIVYTVAAVVLDLIVQIPCAYALSRKNLPFRRGLNLLFIFTMYFNGGMIPKYLLIRSLGMIDSPWSVIVPGCVNVFNLIVAKNFFESSIPESLYDAARIDGAGYTRFFAQIVLPLSPTIIAILVIYNLQNHWNAYLEPQMYLYSSNLYTLQQVIRNVTMSLDVTQTESLSIEQVLELSRRQQLLRYSVVVVSCAPLVVIYPFIQKYFIKGVMVGAVKG